MTATDFMNVDELWEWLQDRAISEFRFLVDELGFSLTKNEVAPTQYSLEYEGDGTQVGLWCSYGSRPEVFIKSGGKREFTNQLISRYAKGWKLPVEPAVFGTRTMREDYRNILVAYIELVKVSLDAQQGGNSYRGRGGPATGWRGQEAGRPDGPVDAG